MAAFYRQTAYRARTERRMAPRVRCMHCRGYMERSESFWTGPGGVGRICTEDCFNEWKDRKRPKPGQVRVERKERSRKRPGIPVELRATVRKRDGQCCWWCGGQAREVHHVNYRSEGGLDEENNLVLLCFHCHQMVHSSKEVYKPILTAYLYAYYFLDEKLSMKQVVRRLRASGSFSELQEERLGHLFSWSSSNADH